MGPGNVFGRVAQWLANEVIVKGLSNNPAFQRFAVRSAQQAKELSKSASKAMRDISENQNVAGLRKVSCLCIKKHSLSCHFNYLSFLHSQKEN